MNEAFVEFAGIEYFAVGEVIDPSPFLQHHRVTGSAGKIPERAASVSGVMSGCCWGFTPLSVISEHR